MMNSFWTVFWGKPWRGGTPNPTLHDVSEILLDGNLDLILSSILSLIYSQAKKKKKQVTTDEFSAAAAQVSPAVPAMVSFGSWSFSCPVSGSSRDSLKPWDITKHQTRDPEKCGIETGIWSMKTEKQTLETKDDCKYPDFVPKCCL